MALEGRKLPYNRDGQADGEPSDLLNQSQFNQRRFEVGLTARQATAYAAYASNSSVCAWGLWRTSRACQ